MQHDHQNPTSVPRHAAPASTSWRRDPRLRGFRAHMLVERLETRATRQGLREAAHALRTVRRKASDRMLDNDPQWDDGLESAAIRAFRVRSAPTPFPPKLHARPS
jgi:hypothetical protein